MKNALLIVFAGLVAAGLVTLMVVKQQSGYTKVYIATIQRQNLTSTVSGTGEIKPKTYVNLGATAMGRVTHLYVKEGDRVRKGEVVATIENVQQEASVTGQKAAIDAARTDILADIAAQKTAAANVQHAQADLEEKRLDWQRAQALYKDGIDSKQNYDDAKADYDLDVASVAQAVAGENQAKANTESARGHLQTQIANLRANQDLLNRTISIAPFDGIVTNEPVRQGETVVEGIEGYEGSTLMTLADMSVVTAEVLVDETDIVNVRFGETAYVAVDALPNRVFKGTVTLVGDQALLRSTGVATSQSNVGTEEAKDFKVVVTLSDPSKELRPGFSCTATITTALKSDVLALPIQALTLRDAPSGARKSAGGVQPVSAATGGGAQSDSVQGVFVAEKDPHGRLRAKFVPVATGITGATNIQVLSGLSAGEQVVTGPYETLRVLKNGALLKRNPNQLTISSTGSS